MGETEKGRGMAENKPNISRRSFLAGTGVAAAALMVPKDRLVSSIRNSVKDFNVGNAAKSVAGETLNIVLNAQPSGLKAASSFLSDFTKTTGIKLNLTATNGGGSWVGFFQAISTKLAGGEAIDSAYIATEGMLLFEERGALDPLDSYMAADTAALKAFYSDVDTHMLANFRALDDLKGHTYFIPIGYNVMSMWINRPMFKEFGVAVPSPDWTWDDFEKAAAKIASAPNRYGFAINTPVPGPFTDVYPWVLTAGGEIMNANQTLCVADNSAAIEAATFVRGLVSKKITNEPPGAYNAFTALAGEKLAMYGAGIWPNLSFSIPQSQVNSQFVIIPWPHLKRSGTPVGVGGFPMFKNSKNKEALWEFIKWSTSEEFQSGPVVPFGGDVPIRKSVATSPSFLKEWPPGTEYFTKELAYSTMIIGVPNAGAVENEVSTAWAQILTGATSPAAGMKTMQDTCNSLMKQAV
jgi:multiple sugar transport system substrate-binding protein